MTTLSIVIPTYQRELLVAAAMRRYLQLLKPASEAAGITLEVIVVDDGSTDRTFQTLKENFSGVDGFKLCQLQANSGPGFARDVGKDLSTGQWIWFLDDDDAWIQMASHFFSRDWHVPLKNHMSLRIH